MRRFAPLAAGLASLWLACNPPVESADETEPLHQELLQPVRACDPAGRAEGESYDLPDVAWQIDDTSDDSGRVSRRVRSSQEGYREVTMFGYSEGGELNSEVQTLFTPVPGTCCGVETEYRSQTVRRTYESDCVGTGD